MSMFTIIFLDRGCGFNPTNVSAEEYIHHCIYDSNFAIARDYSDEDNNYTGSWNYSTVSIQAKQILVRNNLAYGYRSFIRATTHDVVGGPEDVWVYNNTLIGAYTQSNFMTISLNATNIKLRNNIYYNTYAGTVSIYDRFIALQSGGGETEYKTGIIDSDYNIMLGANWDEEASQGVVRVNFDYYTLAEWITYAGCETHSIFADALVTTTITNDDQDESLSSGFGDLSTGSPAIDVGNRVNSIFDYHLNKRALTVSLGAVIYEE